MDLAVKIGYLQPYKKGLHLVKDDKTLWPVYNLTDSVTVPHTIKDNDWKYYVGLFPDLPAETKKQLENILKADGKIGGKKK